MTKHTPGPWRRVVSRGVSAAYTRIGADDYGVVAECSGFRPSLEENAANARLIVAAPDLLAALLAIVAEQPSVPVRPGVNAIHYAACAPSDEALYKVLNAIERATGGK